MSVTAFDNPVLLTQGLATSIVGDACIPSSNCLAVGASATVTAGSVTYSPQAFLGSGSSWKAIAVPSPPLATRTVLDSVACPVAYLCIAVGAYVTSSSPSATPNGLIEEFVVSTSTWVIDGESSSLSGELLTSISTPPSPSGLDWVVVGDTKDPLGNFIPSNWVHSSSGWAPGAAFDLGGTTSLSGGGSFTATSWQINSVSCASLTFCVAVGVSTSSLSSASLVEIFNGTSWIKDASLSSVEPALASGSPVTVEAVLDSVSCPSTSFCALTGDYTATGAVGSYVATFDGSNWAIPYHFDSNDMLKTGSFAAGCSQAILKLSSTCGYSPYMSAISCASPSYCAAVGDYSIGMLQFGSGSPSGAEFFGSFAFTLVGGVGARVPEGYIDGGGPSELQPGSSNTTASTAVFDGLTCTQPYVCTAAGWVSILSLNPANPGSPNSQCGTSLPVSYGQPLPGLIETSAKTDVGPPIVDSVEPGVLNVFDFTSTAAQVVVGGSGFVPCATSFSDALGMAWSLPQCTATSCTVSVDPTKIVNEIALKGPDSLTTTEVQATTIAGTSLPNPPHDDLILTYKPDKPPTIASVTPEAVGSPGTAATGYLTVSAGGQSVNVSLASLPPVPFSVTGTNFVPGSGIFSGWSTSFSDAHGLAWSMANCSSPTTCSVQLDPTEVATELALQLLQGGSSSVSTDLRASTTGGTSMVTSNDMITFSLTLPKLPSINPTGGNGGSNPSGGSPQCNATPSPVNCASGDFWHTNADLAIPGRGVPLNLTRTYNSLDNAQEGPFGFGWACSYCMSLQSDPTGNVVITQENGSTVSFSPDGSGGYTPATGMVASLTHNLDGTWSFTRRHRGVFTFDSSGTLTAQSDLNGYVTTVAHDTNGHLASVTDPAGRMLTFVTNASGQVTAITDPMGRKVTYSYDASGNLVSSSDPDSNVTRFGYDAAHEMVSLTDPNGGVTTNTYGATTLPADPPGSLPVVSQSDPMGRKTTFSYSGDNYSAAGGTTTLSEPNGAVQVEHFANGELNSLTKAAGSSQAATWSYTYDAASLQVATLTDPDGHVTSYTYNPDGLVLTKTDPIGRKTAYSYDVADDLTSVTDPTGATATYAFDARGNLTALSDAQGNTTTLSYADPAHLGDVTGLTDADGHTTQFTYDPYGDVASVSDALGDKTTFSYNLIGQKTAMVSPDGNVAGGNPSAYQTSYAYDANGNLVSTVDPDGHVTTNVYDPNGNVVSVTDASGHTTTYIYDADNERVKTVATDGSMTTGAFDVSGNQVTATNADGQTMSYGYDVLNRVVSTTDALGHVSTYAYDPAGNQTSIVSPNGVTTTYHYDAGNETTGISFSDGKTAGVVFSYDAAGRRVSMVDSTGTSTYAYNALGELTAQSDGAGAALAYSYDRLGNVDAITYPNGKDVTYAFDAANRMVAVTDWEGHATRFSYDQSGNKIGGAYPNGISSTDTFDPAGQLTGISDTEGSTTLASYSYARNPDGLLANSATSGTNPPAPTQSYSYSQVNELVKVTTGSTVGGYTYDPAGNLTGLGTGASLSYNAADEVTSASLGTTTSTYSYDANGNRTGQSGAGVGAGSCVVCLISPSASPALSATGTASIRTAGVITVDSSSPTAASATGTASIAAGEIFSAGGVSTTGKATIGPLAPPDTGITANPFGGIAPPTAQASPQALNLSGHASQNIQPGVYSTISVTGNATLTLASGTYVVTGGISVAGSGKIVGSNATVYLACSNYPVSCLPGASGAGMTVSGTGAISLSGAQFGQGAVVYSDTGNAASVSLSGNGSVSLTGSVDVAAMALSAAGNATVAVSSGVVALASASATGSAVISIDKDASAIPSTTYSYDGANRLVGLASGSITATYTYGGDNLRASAVTNGSVYSFTWDTGGGQPHLLADSTNFYVYGPGGVPIEQVNQSTGAPTYLFTDQLGSVVMEASQAGVVTATQSYTAYGSLATQTGTNVSPFGFAGGYTDVTGIIYLVNRYYDPATGQFVSVDPAVAFTEAAYSYANGDPIDGIDPMGLLCLSLDCIGNDLKQLGSDVVNGVKKHWKGIVQAAGIVAGAVALASGIGEFAAAAAATGEFIGMSAGEWATLGIVTGAVAGFADLPNCFGGSGFGEVASCIGAGAGFAGSALWGLGKLAGGTETLLGGVLESTGFGISAGGTAWDVLAGLSDSQLKQVMGEALAEKWGQEVGQEIQAQCG